MIVFKGIGNPSKVREHYRPFLAYLARHKFHYLSQGDFRIVYERIDEQDCGVVVKVPTNRNGIIDNIVEFKAWKKYGHGPTDLGIYLAPCRLLPNNALMMPFVDAWNYGADRFPPKWAEQLDNYQCGLYRGRVNGIRDPKGRVVAYDYALNVTERYQWERELKIRNSFFQRTWMDNHPEVDTR
jgi:hypothetical protein